MSASKVVPVLFLDLDGTVRYHKDGKGGFINQPEDVAIFAGVLAILRKYRDAGWRIVGVSNQGGVALGHLTAERCHAAILKTQELCDNLFDEVIWCQHHPDALNVEQRDCWCRKPKVGMLFKGLTFLGWKHQNEIYPHSLALMVGDRPEDEACAKTAGIRFEWAEAWRQNGSDNASRT